jgi:NADPH:quinone reductase-like Zn-dependent oxidoreductase
MGNAANISMLFPLPKATKEIVLMARELIEAGKYGAVIDRRYPLAEIVEATQYVETQQKTGNVVIPMPAPTEGPLSRR